MEHSDEALAERARRDPEAFAELVRRYQNRVANLAYRMTGARQEAEDIAQEAFIRAYRGLSGFRKGSPFSPWLYRIAVNLSLDHRRQQRHQHSSLEELGLAPQGGASPETVLERRGVAEAIQQALISLPGHYRVVLVLRHLEDLSYEEIAQTLELPLGTVKVRLHRGRELLRARLRALGIR